MERFPSFPAVNLSTLYAHVKYLSIVYTTFTVLFPPYLTRHRILFTRIAKRICSGKTTPSLPGTSATLRLHRRGTYTMYGLRKWHPLGTTEPGLGTYSNCKNPEVVAYYIFAYVHIRKYAVHHYTKIYDLKNTYMVFQIRLE